MPSSTAFSIHYAAEVVGHLKIIDRRFHGLLRDNIAEQLKHSPTTETRNRKLLRQPAPFLATWELRLGPENRFRVFYDVDESERTVIILAIGVKRGNRLFVGDEEYTS